MTETNGASPRVIVHGHPGEIDTSRLDALERRIASLEDLVEKLGMVCGQQHDNLSNRVRGLELAS